MWSTLDGFGFDLSDARMIALGYASVLAAARIWMYLPRDASEDTTK